MSQAMVTFKEEREAFEQRSRHTNTASHAVISGTETRDP